MRPIDRDRTPPGFGLRDFTDLLQGFGPYCSFCERPLPDEVWLWNKRAGSVFSSSSHPLIWPGWVWGDLLLLDRNCALSHKQRRHRYRQRLVGRLLTPDDEELSFRHGEKSPIEYALKAVSLVIIDEDGAGVSRRNEEFALAIGHTDAAIRTIDHFALNTRYFTAGTDGNQDELRIPEADYLSALDRRVEQRTQVWRMAESIARILSEASGTDQQSALIDEARLTIAAAGFWSTWATVLGRLLSEDFLLSLLAPSGRPNWTSGPGPHNTFPGTRKSWIRG